MNELRPPLVLAIYNKDYTDGDVELAKSGLIERGFNRQYLMTSQPPKLTADFDDDASQERIDEMMSFLRTDVTLSGRRRR
jgi:hypothetical protein